MEADATEPKLTDEQSELDSNDLWRQSQVAEMEIEITKLSDWFKSHRFPSNLYRSSSMKFDLHTVDEEITFALYDYVKYQNGKSQAVIHRLATLGWATWAATHASYRLTGSQSIYFRQLAKLGGTILRAMTFRQLLEWSQQQKQDALEKEVRQSIPSPWKDAECTGCHAKKRTWADMTKWICARCGTPLGHIPAS